MLLLVFPPQHVVKLQDSYKVKVKSMGTLNIRVHQDIKDSWYLGKSFLGCFLSCGGSLRTASVILAANSTELLTGQNIEKLQEKKPVHFFSPSHTTLLGVWNILLSTLFNLNLNRTFPRFPREKQQWTRGEWEELEEVILHIIWLIYSCLLIYYMEQ